MGGASQQTSRARERLYDHRVGGGDKLVLCYHAVSEDWPADLSIPPRSLERQLAGLAARGYRGVTFSDAVAAQGAERLVAVTFDDAYRSVHRLAWPILDRLGWPGTVFVPTAYVGSEEPMSWPGIDRWVGGPHEAELLCMGPGELAELAEGGWEVGAHTHSHPRLSQVRADSLADELERPRALLQDWLGRACDTLAYPYGDFSPAVVAAARSAGYSAAATLGSTAPTHDSLLWPRVGAYWGEPSWRFRLKVAPLVRRVELGRLRHPLTRA